jgi:hypothetical protein
LRILVNRIIVQHGIRAGEPGRAHEYETLINQLATDVCISGSCFTKSPCKYTS